MSLSQARHSKLVKDGAISHARVKLGVPVFRDMFYKFVLSFTSINPDFYGWATVMFDGTSMTMSDTESNRDKFGKPKSNRGSGAFPQTLPIRRVGVFQKLPN